MNFIKNYIMYVSILQDITVVKCNIDLIDLEKKNSLNIHVYCKIILISETSKFSLRECDKLIKASKHDVFISAINVIVFHMRGHSCCYYFGHICLCSLQLITLLEEFINLSKSSKGLYQFLTEVCLNSHTF